MKLYGAARRFLTIPETESSLGLMFVGFAVYFVGAFFLVNRFVVIAGWLLSIFGIVNYVRALRRRLREPIVRAKQPWEK